MWRFSLTPSFHSNWCLPWHLTWLPGLHTFNCPNAQQGWTGITPQTSAELYEFRSADKVGIIWAFWDFSFYLPHTLHFFDEPLSACIHTKVIHNFSFSTILINNEMETIFSFSQHHPLQFWMTSKGNSVLFFTHNTFTLHGLLIWCRAAKGILVRWYFGMFSNFDWFSVDFFQGHSQLSCPQLPKAIKETLLCNFLFSLWNPSFKIRF